MKVVSVVGNRPQFIKAAPLSAALRAVCDHVLVHTGQHYDAELSQIFFDELGAARRRTTRSRPARAATPSRPPPCWSASSPCWPARRPTSCWSTATPTRRWPDRSWPPSSGCPSATSSRACARSTGRCRRRCNRVVADVLSDLRFCPSPTAVAEPRGRGHLGRRAPGRRRDGRRRPHVRARGRAARGCWSGWASSPRRLRARHRPPPVEHRRRSRCRPWSRCSRRSTGRPCSRSTPARGPPWSARAWPGGPRRPRPSPRRSATSTSPRS